MRFVDVTAYQEFRTHQDTCILDSSSRDTSKYTEIQNHASDTSRYISDTHQDTFVSVSVTLAIIGNVSYLATATAVKGYADIRIFSLLYDTFRIHSIYI